MSVKELSNLLDTCDKSSYSKFGVFLGLPLDMIKKIEKGCGPGDCAECLQQMLWLYWKNMKHVDDLCTALEKIDRKKLSIDLRHKYKGTSLFYQNHAEF